MSEQKETALRGIRGAIDVTGTDRDVVREAVGELLAGIVTSNDLDVDDVAAAVFSVTDDLVGANPAAEARSLGWSDVPLLMVREHGGGTRLERCVRLLVLWNTAKRQSEIRHVYLRGAAVLRPDLAGKP